MPSATAPTLTSAPADAAPRPRPRSRASRRRPGDAPLVASATMTPMIDVVFLLIIFFMLVAQITRQQIVELELPTFEPSAAIPVLEEGRLVLNIVPRAQRQAQGTHYIAGGLAFGGGNAEAGRLIEVLRATAQRQQAAGTPPLEVLLRAEAGERYAAVHAAMELIRQAGVSSVHLMTLDEAAAARLRRTGNNNPTNGGDAP